jgi:hypothetical protein
MQFLEDKRALDEHSRVVSLIYVEDSCSVFLRVVRNNIREAGPCGFPIVHVSYRGKLGNINKAN